MAQRYRVMMLFGPPGTGKGTQGRILGSIPGLNHLATGQFYNVAVDLSDNTNLWGTHPAALERIAGVTTDDLARYPDVYADTLRVAVSERFDVDPECVTTGAGSDDVLDSAFRAAYAPGAAVSFAAPTFSMVEAFALMNGMKVDSVPWADALSDPSLLLASDPAVVYVCRHSSGDTPISRSKRTSRKGSLSIAIRFISASLSGSCPRS